MLAFQAALDVSTVLGGTGKISQRHDTDGGNTFVGSFGYGHSRLVYYVSRTTITYWR